MPLRIGLLGAARITPPALVQPASVIPAVRLAGIAARDCTRAEAFATQHGVTQVYDSYDALIASEEIDLIYNALPIDAHAGLTIAALQAGKHVLCEKPLAMNASEGRAMQAAAETSGKRLIEAFHYRYHPAFQIALDWIADGRIGAVQSIDADFHVTIPDNGTEIRHRPERGGGAMMDLGCYPLSWTLEVMGAAPEQITAEATLTPSGVDETLTAELSFTGGVTAKLSASMAAGVKRSARLTVIGTDGRIDFLNPLAPHIGARLTLTSGGDTEHASINPISTYTWQLAAVAAALQTGAVLLTEGAGLLRQQESLDAIYAAAGLAHLRQIPTGANS